MATYRNILILISLFSWAAWAAVSFTEQPSIQYNSAAVGWNIRFAVSEYTDVEVTILKTADSSIVRRLVVGKLGANPPSPLTANSLIQTILWDGRDELGDTVDAALPLSVRVRAGMSVVLDKILDHNPYYFTSILGISKDDNGNIFIYGGYGMGSNYTLRQFDANGNYLRTALPFAAGLDTGSVFGWGVNLKQDNTYCLKYQSGYNSWLSSLGFSPVALGDAFLKLFTIDNKAFFTRGNNFFLVGADGSIGHGGELPFITSPATAPNCGPQFYTKSPDGNTIYISGAYTSESGGGLDRTGFWQDGRVFRMNMQTGVVQPWHAFIPIDSIPDLGAQKAQRYATIGPTWEAEWYAPMRWAAIHGIAFDDSGHVLICDRMRQEVGIYDTATFAKVGAISVSDPHMVEVNKKTGEIYVLSGRLTGYWVGEVSIRKYSGWQNPTLTASLLNFQSRYHDYAPIERFVLVDNAVKPMIWFSMFTVLLIQDEGDHFTIFKNFDDLCVNERTGKAPGVYERLVVDRRNETVYSDNGKASLFKISDWNTIKVAPCTTSNRQRLYGAEAAVSADGSLYVRAGSGFNGPLLKFTTDYYPAPVSLKGSNQVHDDVYGKMGVGYGELGFTVGRTGRVYIMEMAFGFRQGAIVHGTDQDSAFHDSLVIVQDPYSTASGIRVGYDGDIYMGYSKRAASHVVPAGFAGDAGYGGVGSIYKLPPSGTRIVGGVVTGLNAYPQGLGVFSPTGPCACRTPRFDLDPWGRLFIPNAITSEVIVADNAGNDIVKFGSYGNVDSKGPGSLVPVPEIPLASPLDVAASDNFIYIADWVNARIVRVKMDYALQNISLPLASAETQNAMVQKMALSARPNPFNPVSSIRVSLPAASRAVLAVYGVDGRLVKTLASGELKAGVHGFAWDASDDSGKRVSAGVYLYRLVAGKRVLMCKAVLAK
jgi:hypothetical protein